MTDEQYVLSQDNRDRAITARSARNTKTHNGKGGAVRLPSDSLTPAQVKKLSSPVKSYSMDHKMSWEAYKSMPLDLQKSYFKKLRDNFHATHDQIGEMMGCSAATLRRYTKNVGIGDRHRWQDQDEYKDKWWRFCKGEALSQICGNSIIEEPNDKDEQPDDEVKKPAAISLDDGESLGCRPVTMATLPLLNMEDVPALKLTEKGDALRSLRIQLQAAYQQIDERDTRIAQLEQEKKILEAQMQVVWGFLGREDQ